MRCVVKNPNERAVVNVVDEVVFLLLFLAHQILGGVSRFFALVFRTELQNRLASPRILDSKLCNVIEVSNFLYPESYYQRKDV
jgi:hypothetical protein